MDEKKETPKSLLDEINKIFSGNVDEQSGFSSYTQEVQKLSFSPDNPYSHAYGLISSRTKDIDKDGWDTLNDPQLFLGSIDNAKSLRIYQLDIYWLTNLFNIAREDPVFKNIFNTLWANLKTELRLTSVMDGTERKLQAFHVPQPSIKKGFGFLKPKSNKKKEPLEYIIPQEDDEAGMY